MQLLYVRVKVLDWKCQPEQTAYNQQSGRYYKQELTLYNPDFASWNYHSTFPTRFCCSIINGPCNIYSNLIFKAPNTPGPRVTCILVP